jgi:hypothetical protein
VEAIEINATLAGVDGKLNVKCEACDGTGKFIGTDGKNMKTCCFCDSTGHHDILPRTDYTASLDPCMRVARKLKFEIQIDYTSDPWIVVVSSDGYVFGPERINDPDNPALTLSTMLAEIAKEG